MQSPMSIYGSNQKVRICIHNTDYNIDIKQSLFEIIYDLPCYFCKNINKKHLPELCHHFQILHSLSLSAIYCQFNLLPGLKNHILHQYFEFALVICEYGSESSLLDECGFGSTCWFEYLFIPDLGSRILVKCQKRVSKVLST
jgi:hypothetical protein